MFAYNPVWTNTRKNGWVNATRIPTAPLYLLIHYAWNNNNSWTICAFHCQTRCHRWRLLSARIVDGPWKAFNVPLNTVYVFVFQREWECRNSAPRCLDDPSDQWYTRWISNKFQVYLSQRWRIIPPTAQSLQHMNIAKCGRMFKANTLL